MRVIWPISTVNGTYSKNFTYNSDEFITDININAISYAFYADAACTTPIAAPTAGTFTFTGKNYYPNGETLSIPVGIVNDVVTNIVDFSIAGSNSGFTFEGKCEWISIVVNGINGGVGGVQIVFDRYTG